MTQATPTTRRWAILGSQRAPNTRRESGVRTLGRGGPPERAELPPQHPHSAQHPYSAPCPPSATVSRIPLDEGLPATLELATVYDAYAPFMWRSLQRMGVPESDLEDAMQEVFIVVHRKLHTYQESKAKLSTWLFGIGINIARRHRAKSRSWLRTFDSDLSAVAGPSQESELQRKQEAHLLNALLGRMRPEHSATFVMFELEGLSCNEIADLTGVPVGTVYSRLHKARDQFQQLAQKNAVKQAESATGVLR